MPIDQRDIEAVAALARIRVDDSEIADVTGRIADIIAMVGQLQHIDTQAVEPLANPLDATQVLRADDVTEPDRREAFQRLAPAVENGLYLVPRVVE